MTDGTPFDETGVLKRDSGAFELLRDNGEGRVRLILQRTPVDLVEKPVRVTGRWTTDGAVDADGAAPA
ncbi:MAG: DUF5818 domain-containing protein [Pseudomonadota bacterium]